ncbi:PiggyBac transposable element-derived protein 4 [Plakobranchus ocellatus]|uniref:PiggyBac transposable element-derived protein 4 n=1 Tax=Plakobranchus ocellatus TaxID=259542 RepID=A0AAV4ATI9_9GAST|nr:PiggyBac transposable element-derived protein 4 [Plakobranchus ocellatus]
MANRKGSFKSLQTATNGEDQDDNDTDLSNKIDSSVGRNPTVNLDRNTALHLVEPFYRFGLNLTCDNFFTGYELAQKLHTGTEKISIFGTSRCNKRFISPAFQDRKLTKTGQPKLCFRKDAILVSYKSRAKKNVILISSRHSDSAIFIKI